MKIVYVCSARLPSERAHGLQIVRMCDALAGLGHEVILLHPSKRQAIDAYQDTDVREYYGCKNEFTVESMSIFQLPHFLWRLPSLIHRPLMNSMNLWFEKRLAKKAHEFDADIYFSRDMTPHAARQLSESTGRCVLEFHQAPSGALATKSLRSIMAQSSGVYGFAVSGLLAQDLEAEFELKAGALDVHHDGVNLDMFEQSVPRSERQRKVVAYVGSIQPNRGVDVLVEAALYCPTVDFSIVGGTPSEVSGMQSLADDLQVSNISFVGQVRPEKVPGHLQNADVIVMPMRGNEQHTVRHASPLKLFEYMASRTPIVATDMPSVREIVEHRETAYLVKPDDVNSLADGINAVLNDPELASQMSAAARSVVADYSWSVRAQRIIERASGVFN
jgi:glycosyltransferase involved in cell wall biosynthesis